MPPKKSSTAAKGPPASATRVGSRKRTATQAAFTQDPTPEVVATQLTNASVTSSADGSHGKNKKVKHSAYDTTQYENGNFAGFVNPGARRKRSQKMKWTPENDVKLMLFGLGKDIKPWEYPKIAGTFPENPTAKAVQERLTKLRKNQMVMLEEMGIIPKGGYKVEDDLTEEEQEGEQSRGADLPPLYPELGASGGQSMSPLYDQGEGEGFGEEPKQVGQSSMPMYQPPQMMDHQQQVVRRESAPTHHHHSTMQQSPQSIVRLPMPTYHQQRHSASRGITEPTYGAFPCGRDGRELTTLPGLAQMAPKWSLEQDTNPHLSPYGYSGAPSQYTTAADVGIPQFRRSIYGVQQMHGNDEFEDGTIPYHHNEPYVDSMRHTQQPRRNMGSSFDINDKPTRKQPVRKPQKQHHAVDDSSDADAEAESLDEGEKEAIQGLKSLGRKR